MTFGINGAELIILILLAVLVLGPEKLPEYTRRLTEWIRTLRRMAEGAKVQFRDETGTDFDEIDWRRYDPRQYDPRRIIREALADPVDDAGPGRPGGRDTGSTAEQTSSGTREALRQDLGAVRSERDALREDLKDMDPRELFFGSSRARRTPAPADDVPADDRPGGTPSGTGSSVGDPQAPQNAREDAVPTPAGTRALPTTSDAATGGTVAATPEDAAAGPASSAAARPAPFDADAT